ncbi:MAG: YggS family pyridoxal phosphate-dependent enzyme [Myxococcales bacterium]|nr:YggS family pyridoxal phosphate-dependent enzyme [Myxococcales bacterium]
MIARRLAETRARVDAAARAAGRDPSTVALLAVSKTHPASAIREAYAAGQRDFGESYAQELRDKAEELVDLGDLRWHFIGHLQTNKAKYVARVAHAVHSVDDGDLARELAKRVASQGRAPLRVLVEVNAGIEAQKAGVSAEALPELLAAVRGLPQLELRGLMTMPPFGDLAVARRVFDRLAALRERLGGAAALPELSMGMSDDLEVAVAAGSTIVRVGTAIFGARE